MPKKPRENSDARKSAGRARVRAVTASIASGSIAAIVLAMFVATVFTQPLLSRSRYLAEHTASGDFILPKNFRAWVYLGSPLTPQALK
jgi:hypothetical protein